MTEPPTDESSNVPKKTEASLFHYVSYYLYKLLCIFLKCTDVRLVALSGRCLGYIVWVCASRRRRIVARNLRIVIDPTLRGRKLSSMIRRNMVRTTMNLACSLKTGLMKQREMEKFIHVEGGEHFEHCGSNGHTVVSCIPHAGNWEVLARIRPLFHRVPRYASMYRRLANPLLEEFVYQSRTRYGCEMYSKEDGLKEILKLAHNGGLLGVLSDQFTAEGIYVPYFGKVTGVTPLPALIYKRCKGKGHLFSVFTRNTALGHWDAVLGREIYLPENCESLPSITMQVNLALEECQNENILDGLWMHHRWKTTDLIAPEMDDDTKEAVRTYARLPFRMIVVSPEDLVAAEELTEVVQILASCRPDAEVTLLCPGEQLPFWQGKYGVARVICSDSAAHAYRILDSYDVYKRGPFDVLFMFGGSRKLWRKLTAFFPLHVVGWDDHELARKFRTRYKRSSSSAFPTKKEYMTALKEYHHIAAPS